VGPFADLALVLVEELDERRGVVNIYRLALPPPAET
jgi:hypothetical protein